MRGIDWPKMHPDEYPIARWVQYGEQPDRLYPGGFFVMVRPIRWVYDLLSTRLEYFQGTVDNLQAPITRYILFTRLVNAWLGSLACVFVYLLGRNVSHSRWAGLLAALLLALSQYPIEHSHYGETDMAMIFNLSLALWLWSEAIRRPGRLQFVAAALTLGFAGGTKFVLVPLLPVFLLYCLFQHGGPLRWRKWAQHLATVLWGLGLFLLGFVAATPRVLHWHRIARELAHGKESLFHETAHNMGALAGDTGIRFLSHLVALGRFLLSMGWGWIVLAALALPVALTKRYRRYAFIVVLCPVMYFFYWVYGAPWVRHQEFMNFLPMFAALAAVCLAWLWQTRRKPLRVIGVLLACAAIVEAGCYGLAVSSVFGWKDTRVLAERWIRRHEPPDVTFAKEKYANVGMQNDSFDILTIEEHGIDHATAAGADYLVSTEGAVGRGMVHPITGLRYPEFEERYRDFRARSERLYSWTMLPPFRTRSGFNGWNIELFGLKACTATIDLDVVLPQPVYLSSVGRETFFPVGHRLGSATGIMVDRHPRTVAIGGPEAIRGPVYVVLSTWERTADVHVRGLGRRKKAHLDPYDVSIVSLRPVAWRPLTSHWGTIKVWAEPEKHIGYIPCFMRVAFSADELVRILCDLGRADKLTELLAREGSVEDCSPMMLFRAAVAAKDWDLASQTGPGAQTTAEAIRRALESKNGFRIAGMSDYYHDQFARIRFAGPETRRAELWPEPDSTGANGGESQTTIPFPALVAAGDYELVGEWSATEIVETAPAGANVEFHLEASDSVLATLPISLAGTDVFHQMRLPIRVGVERRAHLRLTSATPVQVRYRNVQLRWNARAQIQSEYVAWLLSSAEYGIVQKEYAKAADLLRMCPTSLRADHDRWRRQLVFELAAEDGGCSPEDRVRAAEKVLEFAPDHYAALQSLASVRPDLAEKVAALSSDGSRASPVFVPFFSVVRASFASETRTVTMVLEALRSETPPFAVGVHMRRRGSWRRKRVIPISQGRRLSRGERVCLSFVLDGDLGGIENLADAGIDVESLVRWHARPLPVQGARDRVVRLSRLCE
jgi:hypothetical protein